MTDRQKILVVDDQAKNIRFVSTVLENAGYEVVPALSGDEALILAHRLQPVVILMDVLMPKLNGYDVVRLLKKSTVTKHIPIVLLSASSDEAAIARGLEAGAEELLRRPINTQEMLARIEMLIKLRDLSHEFHTRDRLDWALPATWAKCINSDTVLICDPDGRATGKIRKVVSRAGFEVVHTDQMSGVLEEIKVCDARVCLFILPDCDRATEELKELLLECASDPARAIILLAESASSEDRVYWLEHGVDYVMETGRCEAELIPRIRASLRRLTAITGLSRDVVRLREEAVTDRLTGLKNRSYLETELSIRFAAARRDCQNEYATMMLDVDNFKSINDYYGHLVGDQVLGRVAQICNSHARSSDVVARYGGEEFCLILTGAVGLHFATIVAERIREAIAEEEFSCLPDGYQITASFGVGRYAGCDLNPRDAIGRADAALLRSKARGKNCVTINEEFQHSGAIFQ